ncbi:MAG: tRNA 2-thiouridine(34) synthase MnmA [Oscillospiraceae bacterium]|jgi:tRNA-specific 2-thiouridylase|nr:tRNA 2-thiouridine(34) synthase MnmA [Oscillospiraceae bacterium]
MTDRALVAMSGGVDSSVAALLLTRAGYDCVGAMMKLFENEDVGANWERGCCALESVGDAEGAARSLDMPFYVYNCAEEFRLCVMDRFAADYERGTTPNPCVECNRALKFGVLREKADSLGCRYIATGHYARVERAPGGGRLLLRRGTDTAKDQSYVLYFMTQEQLSGALFPLGELTKPQVRQLAIEHGFANAQKRESQDICFVRGGGYAGFIEAHTGKRYPPGPFVDSRGGYLGSHGGIIRYTVGQRRGLGSHPGGKMYVTSVRADENTVVLGRDDELYTKSLTASDINIIPYDRLDGALRVTAKIRYSHEAQPATARQTGPDELRVEFDLPQRAITPGQAVVLYDGDIVIGGGTIVG